MKELADYDFAEVKKRLLADKEAMREAEEAQRNTKRFHDWWMKYTVAKPLAEMMRDKIPAYLHPRWAMKERNRGNPGKA